MCSRATTTQRRVRRQLRSKDSRSSAGKSASLPKKTPPLPVRAPAATTPTANAPQDSTPQMVQRQPHSLPQQPASPHLDITKENTVTVKEAAFRLGKSADTVYMWLRTGRLQGWQPGGRGCAILVAEASVEKALSSPVARLGGRVSEPFQAPILS